MPGGVDAADKDLAALTSAFEVFNEASVMLERSYRTLELQSEQLREQLREADRARRRESARKEKLAEELSALLEALPAGVVVLDAKGRVTRANGVARRMLGAADGGGTWQEIAARVVRRESLGTEELVLDDGQLLSLSHQPLAAGGGRILLIRDVTEQRSLEDALSRHKRLAELGQMATSLAHQLRTPLASALLYVTNAQRNDIDPSRRQRMLVRSADCLRHLEQLIGDMLLFTRGSPYRGAPFAVSDLLSKVELAIRPRLMPDQCFTAEVPSSDVQIRGNRDALVGAVLNLVSNALEAAGDQGTVSVAANADSSGIAISVRDNGPGVPADQRQAVFEPFHSTRSSGTGLGLAIVRSVAQAHGGDVFLREPNLPGAVFSIELPSSRVLLESDEGESDSREAAA